MRIFGSMYKWSTADTSEEVVPGKNITSTMVLSSARSNPANSAGAVDLQTSRIKRSVSFDIYFIFTGLFMHETMFILFHCRDKIIMELKQFSSSPVVVADKTHAVSLSVYR